jgi:hypothetical protein
MFNYFRNLHPLQSERRVALSACESSAVDIGLLGPLSLAYKTCTVVCAQEKMSTKLDSNVYIPTYLVSDKGMYEFLSLLEALG